MVVNGPNPLIAARENRAERSEIRASEAAARAAAAADRAAQAQERQASVAERTAGNQNLSRLQGLRQEFRALPEVKTFTTARQQYQALRNIAGRPNATAQDDIAAIFSFMKTLDPSSTVREGEFATAQNAAGVPDTIRNAFNRASNGERLNPQQRKQMVDTAWRSYGSFRDAYNAQANEFRRYAQNQGVNPDDVARTYGGDRRETVAKPQGRMGQFKVIR